jgi:hypothetical protein
MILRPRVANGRVESASFCLEHQPATDKGKRHRLFFNFVPLTIAQSASFLRCKLSSDEWPNQDLARSTAAQTSLE